MTTMGAQFTPLQVEILRLLSIGKERLTIADLLGISRTTVGRHLTRMRDQIGCETAEGLIGVAFREGLIQ